MPLSIKLQYLQALYLSLPCLRKEPGEHFSLCNNVQYRNSLF